MQCFFKKMHSPFITLATYIATESQETVIIDALFKVVLHDLASLYLVLDSC